MGTTQTDLRAKAGLSLQYVLVIEGYQYLLTDGDPAAAVTAWAATDWVLALPGLQVVGTFSQSLEPWSNELSTRPITFKIQPEATDQFGIDMFKSKPSVRTELTTAFDSDADAGSGFNIDVQSSTPFASSGTAFIGNEAFSFTSKPSGTQIGVKASGAGFFSPFGGDATATNTFPGAHSLAPNANVNTYNVNAPVYVTDAPATWVGKKVGLFVHRVLDGVLDVKAQAESWWAGTIAKVTEDEDGSTVLQCDGIEQALIDAVLMHDQWQARPREGYTFLAADLANNVEADFVRVVYTTTNSWQSARFTAGVDFTAGRLTASEFGALLSDHLDADGTVGRGGSGITLRWGAGPVQTPAGVRFQLRARDAGTATGFITILASSYSILEFLGFDTSTGGGGFEGPSKRGEDNVTSTTLVMTSELGPMRFPGLGITDSNGNGLTLTVEDSDGTFVDHTSILPPSAQTYVGSGETWSFYSIGDGVIFLGRRDSATQISSIVTEIPLSKMARDRDKANTILRVGDGEAVTIKQVFFAADTFKNIVTKIFASTDGKGQNHATWDVFPFGAGIPWDLLGSGFTESLDALEQSGVDDSVALVIEKPTRLWDALRSDFALRMASPVWKNGGLVVAQLSVPNASTSDHSLDHTNKIDSRQTLVEHTDAFLVHTLKVDYNRNPLSDKYADHFVARDITAYQAAGGAGQTKTIRARNSYSGVQSSGTSAEALTDLIASRFLPVFSKPLKRWRRSIPHTLFHMAPGDSVDITDLFVRDPNTGTRGISVRAGTVLSVTHQFGFSGDGQDYIGAVDILFSDEDRTFPLAPSLQSLAITQGAYTLGWDSVGLSLLVEQINFSNGFDIDGFEASDAIRITEHDPADPTAAASFTDVMVSKSTPFGGADEITLRTGFGNGGNPAYDGTKTYLVNYDKFTSVQTAQKLKSFQADNTDGQILDTIDPNIVADTAKSGGGSADITILPARHSNEQFGDGEPLSASFIRDQVRMANNLVNYKCSPHGHAMLDAQRDIGAISESWEVVQMFPYYIGTKWWLAGRQRKINVAPFTQGDAATATNCRVSSSQHPVSSSSMKDPTWKGAVKHVTFTTAQSAALATLTVQALGIVPADFEGITWITVSCDAESLYGGLSALWLGPIE